MNEIYNTGKKLFILICFLIFFLAAGTASAHKVVVFAWVEGGTVFMESKFAGGKKVKQGQVIVSDKQGNQLLSGKTSDQGEFSFKVPKKAELIITVSAGMGHQGEWTISLEELEETATRQTNTIAIQERPGEKTDDKTEKTDEKENHIQSAMTSGLSPDHIQSAMEKALDKKLKPVIKMLAESQNNKPSMTDIIGGIGYILGLMGIAAYFNFRRKKD